MTNLQVLEQKIKGYNDLKRVIKKGEKIVKGEGREEIALEFENLLVVEGLEYEVNHFKTMTIFTFPVEEVKEEVLEGVDVNECYPQPEEHKENQGW